MAGKEIEDLTDELPQWVDLVADDLEAPEETPGRAWLMAARMLQHRTAALYERDNGNIVLGGVFGSVIEHNPAEGTFEIRHHVPDLNAIVTGIAETAEGRLLVAINNIGIPEEKEGGLRTWDRPRISGAADIAVDHAGQAWIGTDHGVWARLGEDAWTHFTSEDRLPTDEVTNLSVDRQGRVWIDTTEGIAVYSRGAWRYPEFVDVEPMLGGVLHWHTADGSLWVRYEEGLVRNPELVWHEERKME